MITAAKPSLTDAEVAAYVFVDTMVTKADSYIGAAPLWYGWALRAAYAAGVAAVPREPKAGEA